ncbi:MAG: FAD-binding protein [Candidatus Sericytochromatia bacterium]|nr:FAD-binding protein [Candidatus Tanganyikabacteria bacterium]
MHPATPEFLALLGRERVLHAPADLLAYDCDAFTVAKGRPDVVVLPESTGEVAEICRIASRHGMPIVPRGAGTGLSGGGMAVTGGVLVGTARMKRILAVDVANRRATVQPGVVNAKLSEAVKASGLCYAPDPSSQFACTIGGNVAENSGGPHTLKYGVTVNHVLGVTVVRGDGEVLALGGTVEDMPGLDLVGTFVGSEGTFGIVTEAIVRLIPLPEGVRTMLGVFDSVDAASAAVASVIRAGVVPAALEMMDHTVIQAVEAAFGFGFPLDAAAVLIVEIDGAAPALPRVADLCVSVLRGAGAREVRVARDEAERQTLWKSRKKAIGALGRYAPAHCTQDGVIPPTRLPEVLRAIAEIAARYRIRIANVFHAGDGNLHPVALFDDRDADEVDRVLAAGAEILTLCVRLGGTLSGEHGIGIEKIGQMALMFSPDDLAAQEAVRAAWDPAGRMNPGKILPQRSCIEVGLLHRRAAPV